MKAIVEKLGQSVTELAEDQRKTEERVGRLEEAVERLAEAQKRTEEEIAKLARSLEQTRRSVGGLARSIAYAPENEAYRHLPSLLKSNYGIELTRRFVRTYVKGHEINIFGERRRNGEDVLLVGEVVLTGVPPRI